MRGKTLSQFVAEEAQHITKAELGKADEPGTSVVGVHYSHSAGLSELHGNRFGTGIKGAELERLSFQNDHRIKDRVYFYNRKPDRHLPIAEAGLGSHVHSSVLHGIYDAMKASPEEKTAFNEAKKKHMPEGHYMDSDLATAFEKAVVDRGYRGYTNGHITVVLNQKVVPTTYEGPRWQLKQAA
jgi:hypothetical protein